MPIDVFIQVLLAAIFHAVWNFGARRVSGNVGVMWFGQFCFLMIISRLNVESPSAVFAAHIVGIEIEAISYLPAVAWGQAAAAHPPSPCAKTRVNRRVRPPPYAPIPRER